MSSNNINVNNSGHQYNRTDNYRAVPQKLNQNVYEQKNCKSMHYKSYEEYAKKLLKNEGISPITDSMVKQTALKIKDMNGGADIKSLDTIKCPVSNAYKARLTKAEQKQINAASNNIAKNVYESIKRWGTDANKLISSINKINKDNAAKVITEYKKYSKNEGICEAIIDEYAINNYNQDIFKSIYGKLQSKAEELHIDINDINEKFNEIMMRNTLSRDKKNLDDIMYTLSMRITMNAKNVRTNKPTTQSHEVKTYNELFKNYNIAAIAYNTQKDWDGLFEDVADSTGHITNIYNRKQNFRSSVLKDIYKQHENINQLKKSLKNPAEFAATFKSIYGIDYNPDNIEKYNAIKQKWIKVDTAHASVERLKHEGMQSLLRSNKMKDSKFASKQQILNSAINSLATAINPSTPKEADYRIRKELREWVKRERPDLSLNDVPEEIQYAKVCEFARCYQKAVTKNLKKELGSKSYEEYQTENRLAYKAAFGLNNDIAARVEDYCHSQIVGGEIVKTGIEFAAISITGGSSSLAALTGGTASLTAITAGVSNVSIELINDATSKTREITFENALGYAAEGVRDGVTTYLGMKGAANVANSAKVNRALSNYRESTAKLGKNAIENIADSTIEAGMDVTTGGNAAENLKGNLLSSFIPDAGNLANNIASKIKRMFR